MAQTPVQTGSGKGLLARELNGASFLSLEHAAHMALVVIVPGLVLALLTSALNMWFGVSTAASVPDLVYFVGGTWLSSMMAVGTVAALCVLAPLLVLFGRRTRLEWHKRHGFVGRLAYKVPLYGALAAITAAAIWFKIQLVTVILATLAFIGVPDAPFAMMYGSIFLPAFIGLLLYTAAWCYVFKLVKGKDYGWLFDVALTVVGLIIAVSLFITAIVKLHETSTFPGATEPMPGKVYGQPYPEKLYQ